MGRYRYKGEWKDWQALRRQKAARMSRQVGGIDIDVRRIFFGLDASTLKKVFHAYELQHGPSARRYAEGAFSKWRSGAVEMTGDTSLRLLKIVPRFIDSSKKFDLIQQLWKKMSTISTVNITVASRTDVETAIGMVSDAISRIPDGELPSSLRSQLSWLSDDDADASQAILKEVRRREAELASANLRAELELLIEAISHASPTHNALGSREIVIPGLLIRIAVRRDPGGRGMSDNDGGGKRELAKINTNNILDEALNRLPQQKMDSLLEKAAGEALRLKVKQADTQMSHDSAVVKLSLVENTVRNASDENSKLSFSQTIEHQFPDGKMTVKIESNVKSKAGCFVATACFDDCEHPTVRKLQIFRDECLTRSLAGRAFIRTYYAIGPALANALNRFPYMKRPLRRLLTLGADRIAPRNIVRECKVEEASTGGN